MKTLKEYFKVLFNSVWIVICGIIAGGVLLTLAYCIPVNQELQQKSYDIIKKEGIYPAMPTFYAGGAENFHSLLPGVLATGTDNIMLYTAGNEITGSPLEAAMRSYNGYQKQDYTRYWHGYVSVLRPLMYFFDFGDIRMINIIGQTALVMFMALSIAQKKGKPYAIMVFTSYMLLMPTALSASLQFTWVFYIAMSASLFVIKKQHCLETRFRYVYFFVVLGMLTSYFDLLTYPLVTWGFPIIWWIVLSEEDSDKLNYLKKVVITGIGWIFGYGFMWLGKGVLGSIVLKQNILEEALNQSLYRLGTGEKSSFELIDRFEAIYVNWKHYSYKIYFIILTLWLLWVIARSCVAGWKVNNKIPAYTLAGFSSIVWYFVLAEHTAEHHTFTHRIFSVSILAFMAIALEVLLRREKVSQNILEILRQIKWKRTAATVMAWGAIGVSSLYLMRCAGEDLLIWNANDPPVLVSLDNAEAETSFIPSFSRIKKFGYGITSESTQGTYIITVLDKEKIVYQEKVPISDTFDEFELYKDIDVKWKLKAGREYKIRIGAVDNDAPVYIVMTEAGHFPLSEYRNMKISNVSYDGQFLSGLTYYAVPLDKAVKLFLTLSWCGILAVSVVTIQSIIPKRLLKK